MLLEVTAFVCGMALMVLELLGARLLAPVFGNSFNIWTGVIGVVLISMSLGYWRGGILADRNTGRRDLARKIFMAGVATILTPLLIVLFGPMFMEGLGGQWGATAAAIAGLSVPCYFLAMVSPYCTRLLSQEHEQLGKVSGRLYAISTIGSILGVFLAGFVLIPYFGVRDILYLLGFVLIILSASLYLDKKSAGEPPKIRPG